MSEFLKMNGNAKVWRCACGILHINSTYCERCDDEVVIDNLKEDDEDE